MLVLMWQPFQASFSLGSASTSEAKGLRREHEDFVLLGLQFYA